MVNAENVIVPAPAVNVPVVHTKQSKSVNKISTSVPFGAHNVTCSQRESGILLLVNIVPFGKQTTNVEQNSFEYLNVEDIQLNHQWRIGDSHGSR